MSLLSPRLLSAHVPGLGMLFGILVLTSSPVCMAWATGDKLVVASLSAPIDRDGLPPMDVAETLARELQRIAEGQFELPLAPLEFPGHRLEADAIRDLAREESAGTVILVEVSKPSKGAIAIAVDLRSGHSGASLYRYRTDVAQGRDLNIALTPNLERIAGEIVRDLGYLSNAENARNVATAIAVAPDVAPVSPRSPKDDALPEVGAAALPAEEEESAFNFFSSDEPLEITSDELEVITREDSKLIIFRENVHAVQGDVTMVSDYLEAFYPSGGSDPDRLNARGRVKVIDLEREIRCREASYLRATEIITCIGDAIMIQGCDEVRGAKIVFNLNDERVTVFGGVSMTLRPEDEAAATECDLEGTG